MEPHPEIWKKKPMKWLIEATAEERLFYGDMGSRASQRHKRSSLVNDKHHLTDAVDSQEQANYRRAI